MWNGAFSPNIVKAKFPRGTYVPDDNNQEDGVIVVEYDYARAAAIEGTEEQFDALRAVGFSFARLKSINSLYSEAWFEPADDDELNQLKDGLLEHDAVDGSFHVKGVISSAQTDSYEFYGTYEDYEGFVNSGFSKAWLIKFGMDNRQGDWGWPWGRERNAFFIEEIDDFRTGA